MAVSVLRRLGRETNRREYCSSMCTARLNIVDSHWLSMSTRESLLQVFESSRQVPDYRDSHGSFAVALCFDYEHHWKDEGNGKLVKTHDVDLMRRRAA